MNKMNQTPHLKKWSKNLDQLPGLAVLHGFTWIYMVLPFPVGGG